MERLPILKGLLTAYAIPLFLIKNKSNACDKLLTFQNIYIDFLLCSSCAISKHLGVLIGRFRQSYLTPFHGVYIVPCLVLSTLNPENPSSVDSALVFSFLPVLKVCHTPLMVLKLELDVQWWSRPSTHLRSLSCFPVPVKSSFSSC